MHITRSGLPTRKGPAENFIGDVYIDAVASPAAPSRVQLALNEVDDDHPAVHWGEHVTDEEYSPGTTGAS